MFEAIYTLIYTFLLGSAPDSVPSFTEASSCLFNDINGLFKWFSGQPVETGNLINSFSVVLSFIAVVSVIVLIWKVFKRLIGIFGA